MHMVLLFGPFSQVTFVITSRLENRYICILKQGSVMVASVQMVTLDSPGSVVMKWSTPTSQLAKLKHLFFF